MSQGRRNATRETGPPASTDTAAAAPASNDPPAHTIDDLARMMNRMMQHMQDFQNETNERLKKIEATTDRFEAPA